MLWPAANLIAFAAIPQVREREFSFVPRLARVFVLLLLRLPPPLNLSLLIPTLSLAHHQDLRILYSNAIGVAWCAYVSLSVAASAAATPGGALPPPPPPFDKLE